VAQPQLKVRDNAAREQYELTVDGTPAGVVTYGREGDVLVLRHTEVDDAYEGQGIGGEFARRVLDDVRAAGLQIRPDCPFIRHYLEEHPEYGDLVVPGAA
jgi:predicted GNAT family acetyltransferase